MKWLLAALVTPAPKACHMGEAAANGLPLRPSCMPEAAHGAACLRARCGQGVDVWVGCAGCMHEGVIMPGWQLLRLYT